MFLLSALPARPVALSADGAPSYLCYKQFSIEEGLSQSRVQCMLYDYKGYLWIGTQLGLNCYDRDELKQYCSEPGDEHSLMSDNILFIAEDSLLNLWIGTGDGLCRFNRSSLDFERIRYQGKPLLACSYHLLAGGVLFGRVGDFFKYDYRTRTIDPLPVETASPYYSPILALQPRNDSVFYARTHSSIYTYNLRSHEYRQAEFLPDNHYTALLVDSRGRLWVSPYGKGLYCYSGEKLVARFDTRNSALSYDVILDLLEKDGTLWAATDGGGIQLISLDDFSFDLLQRNADDIASFPADAVYCLYNDPNDNLWAGSIRNGLIGIKKVYARSFGNVPPANPYGLSSPTVNCFFQDKDGKIWIGTDGGGVNCYDPKQETFRHFPLSHREKITAIIGYDRNELLVSSFDKGLFYFDKRTGALRPFIILNEKENREICRNGFSVNLRRIDSCRIMINAKDIYLYDIRKKSFTRIASHGKDYVRYAPLIKKTADGRIYLMDYRNVYEYDRSRNTFDVAYEGKQEILDMCIDRNGHLWMGCIDGLYFYNRNSGETKKIETNLFDGINSLAADRENRIWIGARNHLLFVYTIATNTFSLMGESDGVSANEYIFDAMLVSEEGDIYIGGVAGMTKIDRSVRFDDSTRVEIGLADVLLDGAPARGRGDRAEGRLTAPWNFTSLQFKIAVNENDVFRKDIFRYRLRGEGRDETIQSFKHSFTVNSLPAGRYSVSVSRIMRNGEWSRPAEILQLTVTPPYWRTVWFTALCTGLLAGAIAATGYGIFKKKQKKQRMEIERLKENMQEDKIRFLINISHELRTPLTLVYAPLKRLLDIAPAAPVTTVAKEELTAIFRQARRMKHIVDRVLDVRKLEEGKEQLNRTENPLNEWVRSVTADFGREAAHRGIGIAYRLDPAVENWVFDSRKCESVLANFLSNALKFSEPGTDITIKTQLKKESGRVRIEVSDQGIGLENADTQQLFERFYQGKHDKSGSGIGLSYAKALIGLHGGTIGAENNAGAGACFYFELPAGEPDGIPLFSETCAGIPSPEKTGCPPDTEFLKSYTILVVEDTDDLRRYLKQTLSEYFSRVYVAENGRAALERIGRYTPDLVVSDVMMPQMNGFELCTAVKQDLTMSHIPVILLTAYGQTENMSAGYKLGADAFIAKPFEMEMLLSVLVNQLKLRNRLKEKYKSDPGIPAADIAFSNADETFLNKLNDLLGEHLADEKLNVAFIAGRLSVSRSLLFSKIKAITGLGIVDYVNKVRIERAAALLLQSPMNITEISESVGFSTPRYFSKVFKETLGTTPSAYRGQGKRKENV